MLPTTPERHRDAGECGGARAVVCVRDARRSTDTVLSAPARASVRSAAYILTARSVLPPCADLANPKTNWNKTPGYTEAETSAFARILNADARVSGEPKFVDVWRKQHPDLRHYTYFSYRFNCREKGIGWRLDMCTYTHPLLSPLFL